MAHVGMGEPFIITKPDAAQGQAERFRKMVQSPVLTEVKVGFQGFDVYDVEPVSIPDVLAQRPVLVFGKWRGKPQGSIQLTGITGDGKYSEAISASDYKPSKDNAALKYLWARHRITILSDYNKLRNDGKRVQEVTELGLNYNMLTAYTSFVAVDNDVRNPDGRLTTVRHAVGGHGNYAASPALYKSREMSGKAENRLAMDKPALHDIQSPQKKDKEKKIILVDAVAGKGLEKDEILKVVRSNLNELEKCLTGKNLSGLIKLDLTINTDGTVNTAEIAAVIKDAKLRQCIIDRLLQWRFPSTAKGRVVKATITLKI
jgi:Ca-activated chloride channel family protein